MQTYLLANLQAGQKGKIVDIKQMSMETHRRLLDLDILEGSVVKIVRKFPFGGPVEIEVNGQHIGIRRQDAEKIEVTFV
ncbi:FeoA family protein [Thermoflavimicrobium dichotomicum]|uniref:Ferrous iron transport protein A n=1 Tax=Thermoflavimicrobium dichotomicum TaxID=46223 RepID=A0A1I3U1M9_9BACL|nr:FeoA family protein [Thermoflavimicrobium dichotomicum]SFJ76870.1 ferrous iron transport protein A [Thermoflavimicrobium dichotomicum]